MPKVYNYTLGNATVDTVSDRLEVAINFLQTDVKGQTHKIKLHVSYKKHLLNSYVNADEAYEPNAAEKNTIATVDSAVFESSFVEYARYMAGKIVTAGQTENFRPRDIVLNTKSIAFGNDTGGLGAEIHCFPVAIKGATGCVELTKSEFQSFVAVTRFLFASKPGENDYQNAFNAWAAIKKKIEEHKLLTPAQITAVQIKRNRWKNDKDEAVKRMKLVGETQSKIEKLKPEEAARTLKTHEIKWLQKDNKWTEVKKVMQEINADEDLGLGIFEG